MGTILDAIVRFLKWLLSPAPTLPPVVVPDPDPVPVPTPDPDPVVVPDPDPVETGNEPEVPYVPETPALPADEKVAAVLRKARSYLGTVEDAKGETEFGRIFNNPTGAWCAMFTSVVLEESGLTRAVDFPYTAWTPSGVSWGQKNGAFFTDVSDAVPGDLVFFMWTSVSPVGRGTPPVCHVGFVEEGVNADGFLTTIEGNTSDSVARRFRKIGVVGFVRPLYGAEKPVLVLGDRVLVSGLVGDDVSQWQAFLNEVQDIFAKDLPPIAVDGDYGPGTAERTTRYQMWAGVDPDRAVGPVTLSTQDAARKAMLPPPPPPAPDVFTTIEQDDFFRKVGLPSGTASKRRESTIRWQEASTWLAIGVDGDFGPLTTADAKVAIKNGYRISPHFKLSEFACPCGGKNAGCKVMQVHGALIRKLEKVRADGYPNGIFIASGYRDPIFNATLAGAYSKSAHLYGLAADFDANRGPDWFLGRGFHGIEVRKWSGEVSHVDLRSGLGNDTVFYV